MAKPQPVRPVRTTTLAEQAEELADLVCFMINRTTPTPTQAAPYPRQSLLESVIAILERRV